jgi:hypothetical protein
MAETAVGLVVAGMMLTLFLAPELFHAWRGNQQERDRL